MSEHRVLFRRSVQAPWLAIAVLAISVCAIPDTASAQTESAIPDSLNKSFKENPDPEKYIKRFETESRSIYKNRFNIIEALDLEPGMDVADVGAGTGFFTLLIANEIGRGGTAGTAGTAYPVDIAENFIEHIKETAAKAQLDNIEAILCGEHSTKLAPQSVDLVFICDTYHHFAYPQDTMASVHQALRPGGRVVVVDFERIQGVSGEWTLGHVRCGKGTVSDEIKDSGFDFVREIEMMEDQYILEFVKREASQAEETAE